MVGLFFVGELLETLLGFAFSEASDGDEGGELFFAWAGFGGFPVVDGETRDTDEGSEVFGGEAEAGAVGA